MDIKSEIKSFWEECHKLEIKRSLSGCEYDDTINFLKVSDIIKPGMNVLEVGVGLGYVTKGLRERGMNVSGLDVSNVGLDRVKPYCERTYHLDEIEQLPTDYFDLILCHNVIQHVPTDTLKNELKHCLRSLKKGGIFAVEFVSSTSSDDTGVQPNISEIGQGLLCRKPRYLKSIITELGGEVNMVVDNKCDFELIKGCHVFHISKK